MIRELRPPAALAMIAAILAAFGCNSAESTSGTETTTTTSSPGGAGGTGGATGAGGGGASGGTGAEPDQGPSATEIVSAGDVCASSKYRLVHTFGQPSQNQGKTTSSSFVLRGGLVGSADRSAP